MSPVERAKQYLSEFSAWTTLFREDGCNGDFYYATHPEFTIRCADTVDVFCNEEWTRGEICRDKNHSGYYELYYHQTLLARIPYVSFDDQKKSMVAPFWKPMGAGRFYFYREDTIDYAVHRFYSQFQGRDDSTTLRIKGDGIHAAKLRSFCDDGMLRIPVIQKDELNAFLGVHQEIQEPSQDEQEQYQLFLHNQLDFEIWRSGHN